jgi:Flp pilus assembly protein TadD
MDKRKISSLRGVDRRGGKALPGGSRPFCADAAYALSKLGDQDGAIKEATTAARLNQGNERCFLNLAELYFEFKKYEQAKTVFEQLTSSTDRKIAALANQRLA